MSAKHLLSAGNLPTEKGESYRSSHSGCWLLVCPMKDVRSCASRLDALTRQRHPSGAGAGYPWSGVMTCDIRDASGCHSWRSLAGGSLGMGPKALFRWTYLREGHYLQLLLDVIKKGQHVENGWKPQVSHMSLNILVWGPSYLGNCQEILHICPHPDEYLR